MDVLNVAQLRDISGGDVNFERELIDLYRGDFENTIVNLTRSLTIREQEVCTRLSHDIKGSSANIGAEGVRRIAEQMEIFCRSGNYDDALRLVPNLRQMFDITIQHYANYFNSHT